MRQLLPTPIDPIDPGAVADDVATVEGRPSVRLNMVVSLDGATALRGTSGGLGGPADRRLFAAYRARADVVVVAAGTMRAERYGPASPSVEAREARRARGQADVPPIAVVTRTCRLDWTSGFFTQAVARPLVITVRSSSARDRAAATEVADVVVAGEDSVDLVRAMTYLGGRGASTVLAEGGPTLNGHLAAAGLVDELCLTVSPRLVGGSSPRIIGSGDLAPPRDMRLHSLCEEDDFVFLRARPI